jgi:hypothetical protein
VIDQVSGLQVAVDFGALLRQLELGFYARDRSRGQLFCRLAVLRQRLFGLLLDTEGVGGGARPEYCARQIVSVSVSPGGAGPA